MLLALGSRICGMQPREARTSTSGARRLSCETKLVSQSFGQSCGEVTALAVASAELQKNDISQRTRSCVASGYIRA